MTTTVEELREGSAKFWPHSLTSVQADASIIPRLIETHDKFISILHFADSSPVAWEHALATSSGLSPRMFLKHLAVLADVGGEQLKRVKTNFRDIWPQGTMSFVWRETAHSYTFGNPSGQWSNVALGLDGVGLSEMSPFNAHQRDVAMVLLHGSTSLDEGIPSMLVNRCVIGTLIGEKEALTRFVQQRYIHVSRITGGADTNALGQLCQQHVRDSLRGLLPDDWDVGSHTIEGISHNGGRTAMSFDIVAVSPEGFSCAIEVSFQVTTNSVIERKAGQARARHEALSRLGHKMAYVIDGEGNFERRNAVQTIIDNSDLVVNFNQLAKLVNFLIKCNSQSTTRMEV